MRGVTPTNGYKFSHPFVSIYRFNIHEFDYSQGGSTIIIYGTHRFSCAIMESVDALPACTVLVLTIFTTLDNSTDTQMVFFSYIRK